MSKSINPGRNEWLVLCDELAKCPDILSAAFGALASRGLIGAERQVKLLYLARISRHLRRPVSVVIKGAPASGKTFVLDYVLSLTPAESYEAFSGMSEKAIVHFKGDLKHKHVVIKEFAGLQSQKGNQWLRQLISDGRLSYAVTVAAHDGSGFKTEVIHLEGPCGVLMTTTEGSLHPEDESRMISLISDDTAEQTRAVLLAQAEHGTADPDSKLLEPWHALDHFIALGPKVVFVPFAEAIAREIDPSNVQMRRYWPMVLTLVQAHALLHQVNRELNDAGAIVATLDDYVAVYGLIVDVINEGLENSVPSQMRAIVNAVTSVVATRSEYQFGVPQFVLLPKLGVNKGVLSRWVNRGLELGYLANDERRPGHSHKLLPSDPLPEERQALPSPDQLRDILKRKGK